MDEVSARPGAVAVHLLRRRRLSLYLELDDSGLVIDLSDLPDWVPPRITVLTPDFVDRKDVVVGPRATPQRRQARTVQAVRAALEWLGARADGECRQAVLSEDAVRRGLATSVKQFSRLLDYAVDDGYLRRYNVTVSTTGGRATSILDWTPAGEQFYRQRRLVNPRPTFYRQAIGRHKSADQVYLAMETRDWLVRTGQATWENVWLLPTRQQVQSAHGGATFMYDPDVVVVCSDGSLLVIELEVTSATRNTAWQEKWLEFAYHLSTVGIVTVSHGRMVKIAAALRLLQQRHPVLLARTRFLLTNVQELNRSASTLFWLMELAPLPDLTR